MSDKTCKNCRWWMRKAEGDCGECACEKFILGDELYYSKPRPLDILVYDGDAGACFDTGPDFGCVHFQEEVFTVDMKRYPHGPAPIAVKPEPGAP